MVSSSARTIGIALATAIMATGSVAMAQMSGTGSTTGNPNTNAELMNRQNAPAGSTQSDTRYPPGTTGSSTYRAPDGSTANSAVSTGNYAKGSSGSGTGQTQLPADPPTGTMGAGAGGK